MLPDHSFWKGNICKQNWKQPWNAPVLIKISQMLLISPKSWSDNGEDSDLCENPKKSWKIMAILWMWSLINYRFGWYIIFYGQEFGSKLLPDEIALCLQEFALAQKVKKLYCHNCIQAAWHGCARRGVNWGKLGIQLSLLHHTHE